MHGGGEAAGGSEDTVGVGGERGGSERKGEGMKSFKKMQRRASLDLTWWATSRCRSP